MILVGRALALILLFPSRETQMFRFDRLIRSAMTVRDVKAQFPQTTSIFEGLGFREICDDCPIEVAAQRLGLAPLDVVEALNQSVLAGKEIVP